MPFQLTLAAIACSKKSIPSLKVTLPLAWTSGGERLSIFPAKSSCPPSLPLSSILSSELGSANRLKSTPWGVTTVLNLPSAIAKSLAVKTPSGRVKLPFPEAVIASGTILFTSPHTLKVPSTKPANSSGVSEFNSINFKLVASALACQASPLICKSVTATSPSAKSRLPCPSILVSPSTLPVRSNVPVTVPLNSVGSSGNTRLRFNWEVLASATHVPRSKLRLGTLTVPPIVLRLATPSALISLNSKEPLSPVTSRVVFTFPLPIFSALFLAIGRLAKSTFTVLS